MNGRCVIVFAAVMSACLSVAPSAIAQSARPNVVLVLGTETGTQ
jgi:hypothetical protein